MKKDEIDDKFIGGNASAEGVDDDGAAEAGTVSGIDIVLTHRLVETGFKNKKEYQIHLKVGLIYQPLSSSTVSVLWVSAGRGRGRGRGGEGEGEGRGGEGRGGERVPV